MSVTLHLVSPTSFEHKYFQGAIVESNPVALRYRDRAEMQQHADTFSKWVDCQPNDADCLMQLDVTTILAAQYKTVDIVC